jgi:acetyl-CoA carboxylase biotin carboxyl carrier protein
MTMSETARLFATEEELFGTPESDMVKRLQETALGLLAGLDRAPRSLRIKADHVEIELEWPDAPAPAGSVAHAPTAAGAAITVAATEAACAVGPTGQHVTAQMVGVFYRSAEPGAEPFVKVGDTVALGQQVGIIEAMKLMIPVEADAAGRITEVLVQDNGSVEYGDRLFAIEPIDG